MEFGKGELITNSMGFMEPKDKKAIEYNKAIILVPLIAIDSRFYRLGRGKGFYDKYIKRNRDRLFTIALAFSPSHVEEIDSDPWDERMDALIVEGAIKTPLSISETGNWI